MKNDIKILMLFIILVMQPVTLKLKLSEDQS